MHHLLDIIQQYLFRLKDSYLVTPSPGIQPTETSTPGCEGRWMRTLGTVLFRHQGPDCWPTRDHRFAPSTLLSGLLGLCPYGNDRVMGERNNA